MRRLILFPMLSCAFALQAQEFTKADSLRGYLFPGRANYDVHYYHLDVEVDPEDRSLRGTNTIHFEVLAPLKTMQIDLYRNMQITSVKMGGASLSFEKNGNATFIELPGELQTGAKEQIEIAYHGVPEVAANAPWDGGFVWSADSRDNPWIGVACEGDGASLWWPCKDHLTEEPDSMLISCTVPEPLMCVANGRLRMKEKAGGGKTTYHWFVNSPINSYNVTLNIARYAHFQDSYVSNIDGDTLSLDYYVLPENLKKAKKHFGQVKPMMDCFEQYFGKYPFYEDGYKLVETPYLGMEHQSAIAYGNKYLSGYLGLDMSGLGFDYIIIHETAHEWFGNSISAGDIAEAWIHESFTTYAEAVYVECMSDYATAVNYLKQQRMLIQNQNPIIGPLGVNYHGWADDTDLYYKGSWMLHSLRGHVNDDEKFFATLHGFSGYFRHQVISTEEVVRYFSDELDMDLASFFNQYLRHADLPVLDFEVRKKGKGAELRYRWKAGEGGFDMPVDVLTPDGTIRVHPTGEWQETRLKHVKEKDIKIDTDRFYFLVEE